MGLPAVARPAMMFSPGPVPLEEGQCPHGTNNTHLSLAAKHPPLMGGKTQCLLAGHQLGLGGDGRLAIDNSTRNGRCTNVSRRPAAVSRSSPRSSNSSWRIWAEAAMGALCCAPRLRPDHHFHGVYDSTMIISEMQNTQSRGGGLPSPPVGRRAGLSPAASGRSGRRAALGPVPLDRRGCAGSALAADWGNRPLSLMPNQPWRALSR